MKNFDKHRDSIIEETLKGFNPELVLKLMVIAGRRMLVDGTHRFPTADELVATARELVVHAFEELQRTGAIDYTTTKMGLVCRALSGTDDPVGSIELEYRVACGFATPLRLKRVEEVSEERRRYLEMMGGAARLDEDGRLVRADHPLDVQVCRDPECLLTIPHERHRPKPQAATA